MGYEIKLIIGEVSHGSPEIERDKSKPYSDGSGFEPKKDKRGNPVKTGRTEHYFSVWAEIDLCKIGYDDNALTQLVEKSHNAKGRSKDCYYFYGTTEGNHAAKEDRYGSPLYPECAKKTLKALKSVQDGSNPYRRYTGAIALLEALIPTSDKLAVMFWGH